LGVAIGEVLDLLLLGDNLLVEEVDLLGGHRVIIVLGLFSRGWCFSANVIEGLFAVRPEFWVLEFPRLFSVREVSFNRGHGEPTFCPYGDWPFSSLFWRTLWKSYLFSWRTKLAKLLCLKCFGKMVFVNFSHCRERSS
jgi:hypothetical protein